MQKPLIPEDPMGHFEDTCSQFAQALSHLVATDAVNPALMTRSAEFIEAVSQFGQACVILAVWMQPDHAVDDLPDDALVTFPPKP